MNISSFDTLAFSTFNVLKEQSQEWLNDQQKKVALVAIVLFASFAFCFIVYRCCFNANVIVGNPPSPKPQHPPA